MFATVGENAVMVEHISKRSGIPAVNVGIFLCNTIIYIHSLACFIVSALIKEMKEEIAEMVNAAAHGFLMQAGADFSKTERNENGNEY